MKFLAALSVQFLLLTQALFANANVETITVTWPVFHPNYKGGIVFAKSPYVGRQVDKPSFYSKRYEQPFFVGEADKGLSGAQDINLISVFNLRVHPILSDKTTTFYISMVNAGRPINHPLSVEEVINFTKKAIRCDFPDKDKFPIRITDKGVEKLLEVDRKTESAEQTGADQPATPPESKPEVNEKPKPKSKVRPQ